MYASQSVVTLSLICLLRAMPAAAEEAQAIDVAPESQVLETDVAYRYPGLALGLSLGCTGVLLGAGMVVQIEGGDYKGIGTGMLIAGGLLGPSAGHMYTGNWLRALAFTGGRAGFLLMGVLGGASALASGLSGESDNGLGAGLLIAGVIGWTGLTIWEITDSWFSAEAFNEEQRALAIGISPMVLPPPAGMDEGVGTGLSVCLRF
ncbi:MAG: hypothetical protein JXR96_06715 [Deltaproteobacteria bacterium]|nr:hypothetical protein [Deltaproteobacteria bacterium]